MAETTFKPMKRGRFKCNQTQKKVKRKQTKALKKSRDNENLGRK